MGYSTDYEGQIDVVPPLNEHEVAYLRKFNATRRMSRNKGPYFVEGTGFMGQGRDIDVADYNRPPKEHGYAQPTLWCPWMPTQDGRAIVWDGGEKPYSPVEWMTYLITHFLDADSDSVAVPPIMAQHWEEPEEFAHFTRNHVLNGVLEAQGEDSGDHWYLVVRNNVVSEQVDRPDMTRKVPSVRVDQEPKQIG